MFGDAATPWSSPIRMALVSVAARKQHKVAIRVHSTMDIAYETMGK